MKTYYLLKLYPAGSYWWESRNECIGETQAPSQQKAIIFFQNNFPFLLLNNYGYSELGDETFCIAEKAF
jgi:hypothetical protein